MAFALIFVGLLLVVSSVRGTTSDLVKQVQSDFTGPGNFIWWMTVVFLLGAIGYIPGLKLLSRALLGLALLALFITKGNPSQSGGGFFAQLLQGLGKATTSKG